MLQIVKHSLFADLAIWLYRGIKKISRKKPKSNPSYAIKIPEIELYTQTLENVRYIRSSINVLSASANYAKGDSAGETRRKRKGIRDQIEWLKEKLKEEESMVIYYKQFYPNLNN